MEGIEEWNGNSDWFHRRPYTRKVLDYTGLLNRAGRDADIESLNGDWHIGLDLYDISFIAGWWEEQRKDEHKQTGRSCYDYSFNQWPTGTVPGCINLWKPETFYFEGTTIYTRKMTYKPRREGERVFLRVAGAQYRGAIFVNREYLGMHAGGSTPFNVEITDHLELWNRIIINVDGARNLEQVPMHFTDWFNYAGLYRDVEIIRVPQRFIKDWFIRLVPGSDFQQIAIDVTVDNPDGGAVRLAIPELGIEQAVAIDADGKGSLVIDAAPALWSPDYPKLYNVELAYGEDSVTDEIGFREIRVEGMDIILNGRPIWLKGICCHECHPEQGKALTRAQIEENINLAKELGCVFMRLAHYPHADYAARYADKVGMLLWEEVPVYWGIQFWNEATYADASNQLSELIVRDRNRASVIIWSVGNENLDTDDRFDFMSKLAARAKELDDSRLVSAACLCHDNKFNDRLIDALDVIGFNEYMGWYNPNIDDLLQIESGGLPPKPVIITETGAGALSHHHGTADDMWTEDFQNDVYARQVEIIPQLRSVRGLTPWILHDFRAPFRQNVYQQGYNRKGLVDETRKHRKLAFFTLQKFYQEYNPYAGA